MEIKLNVHGVLADPNGDAQVILLRDEGNDILPIWVGITEGNAIRLAIEGVSPPRPLTHDLLRSMLDHLKVKLVKVIVTEIMNSTYYAKLILDVSGEEKIIDSRPSDAIALALRLNAPIYVMDEVLKKKSTESLDEWLERLKPGDYGRYNA